MSLEVLKDNLEKKGYRVELFPTKEAAADYLDGQLDGRTIGIGGSQTVHQMGLYEKLKTHNTVYWHDVVPEGMTVKETRRAASASEVYISSVNGISEGGQIVNIDNTGNRTAAISCGPDLVILVIGRNKAAKTFEDALWRARNIAAPLNAKRLNRKTPCAAQGDRCYHCTSPDRICRHLSVLWTKPAGAEYLAVLIDEDLGY